MRKTGKDGFIFINQGFQIEIKHFVVSGSTEVKQKGCRKKTIHILRELKEHTEKHHEASLLPVQGFSHKGRENHIDGPLHLHDGSGPGLS